MGCTAMCVLPSYPCGRLPALCMYGRKEHAARHPCIHCPLPTSPSSLACFISTRASAPTSVPSSCPYLRALLRTLLRTLLRAAFRLLPPTPSPSSLPSMPLISPPFTLLIRHPPFAPLLFARSVVGFWKGINRLLLPRGAPFSLWTALNFFLRNSCIKDRAT